jgi:Transcriptional regulator, AbiEi antitoxin/Protein of unknown function (DUF559)
MAFAFAEGEIFTTSQAEALGIGKRARADLVHTGAIARIGRGVYTAGGDRHEPRAVSTAMKAAISHESGAAWVGASLLRPPTELHVTTPRNRGRRRDCIAGVRLHRSDVPDCDLIQVRGALVTTPLRTVLDLARSKPTEEAVAIADSMSRLRRFTPEEARSSALALPPGPGRQAAIRVTQLIDPLAESVFESISRVAIATAGLPMPVPQHNIFDRGRWIARVDFCWPQARLILECDGYEFHHDREAFERDRRRWTALTRAEWKVVVVTWRDVVGEPTYLVELIADLLDVKLCA